MIQRPYHVEGQTNDVEIGLGSRTLQKTLGTLIESFVRTYQDLIVI